MIDRFECHVPTHVLFGARSDWGVTADELPAVVEKYHGVFGGNNDANPLPLSDEDLLGMYQRPFR